jgi:hypothetical protein
MVDANYISSVESMFATLGQLLRAEKAERDAVENVSKGTNADVATYDYEDTFETSAVSEMDSGTYNKPTNNKSYTSSSNTTNEVLSGSRTEESMTENPLKKVTSFEDLFEHGMESKNLSLEKQTAMLKYAFGHDALELEKKQTGFDINVIPTTVEGKIEYNKKVLDLWNNNEVIKQSGISMPMLSCFNDVEGMDWEIGDGAEELIGHEIMEVYQLGNTNSKLTSNTSKGSTYGVIDEYGFAVNIPAVYFNQSQKERIEYAQEAVLGTVFDPTIKYEDALGLAGMNIDERKTFLTRVQNILDQVTPEIKSTQLKYTIGDFDLSNGKMIGVSGVMGFYLSDNTDKINQALKNDKTLFEMLSKAQNSQNKHVDELTISVTNSAGVPLAKNEIIVSGNGKSMKTTVDEIKNISYASLLDKIRKS